MKTRKNDRVLIRNTYRGTVVQDGCQKSLVSTRRSDNEPGWEQDWYDNDLLTVTSRRKESTLGTEAEQSIKLY